MFHKEYGAELLQKSESIYREKGDAISSPHKKEEKDSMNDKDFVEIVLSLAEFASNNAKFKEIIDFNWNEDDPRT